MSEMKVITNGEIYNMIEYEGYCRTDDLYYIKSEADKVIADLEESHKNEVGQLLIEIVELKGKLKNSHNARKYWRKEYLIEYKECRHQKYKRCLAMAMWCEATALWCYQAANTLPSGFHATLNGKRVMIEPARLYNRFWILTKWNRRWLELAEKFKETK